MSHRSRDLEKVLLEGTRLTSGGPLLSSQHHPTTRHREGAMDVTLDNGLGHKHTSERIKEVTIPTRGVDDMSECLVIEHDAELGEIRVINSNIEGRDCVFSVLLS